jgi:hypothetical protein
MARGKKSKGVPVSTADITNIAKNNPYIQQLINDPKLRKNVQTAIASSKKAAGRVNNGKMPARALLEDKKLHAEVGKALGASRDAAITLTRAGRKRTRRGRKTTRRVVIVVVGTGAALAASSSLRSKVLDVLFGKEEEFQYTPPPNSGSTESTTPVGGAA